MKNIGNIIYLLFLSMNVFCATYAKGRLNFIVDGKLNIRAASAEKEQFYDPLFVPKSQNVCEVIPLSDEEKASIIRAYAEAVEKEGTTTVSYVLQGIVYRAKITPLMTEDGDRLFFVKVKKQTI